MIVEVWPWIERSGPAEEPDDSQRDKHGKARHPGCDEHSQDRLSSDLGDDRYDGISPHGSGLADELAGVSSAVAIATPDELLLVGTVLSGQGCLQQAEGEVDQAQSTDGTKDDREDRPRCIRIAPMAPTDVRSAASAGITRHGRLP